MSLVTPKIQIPGPGLGQTAGRAGLETTREAKGMFDVDPRGQDGSHLANPRSQADWLCELGGEPLSRAPAQAFSSERSNQSFVSASLAGCGQIEWETGMCL